MNENTKHQTPNTRKASSAKHQSRNGAADGTLVFGIWCFFGVWCLGLGVSAASGLKTKTQHVLELLRLYESRNVTFIEPDDSWPIVWERACGVHVWDAEGKKYLDLTAGFGVAATGHANTRVVKAGQQQMERLLHAMGDVQRCMQASPPPMSLDRPCLVALPRLSAGRSREETWDGIV